MASTNSQVPLPKTVAGAKVFGTALPLGIMLDDLLAGAKMAMAVPMLLGLQVSMQERGLIFGLSLACNVVARMMVPMLAPTLG